MIGKEKLNGTLTLIKLLGIAVGLWIFPHKAIGQYAHTTELDVNKSAYLITTYCDGVLISQSWVKDRLKFPFCMEPDQEASVFENDENRWNEFIDRNLEWPKDIEGKVLTVVFIDKKGKVVDKRIVKSIPDCRECNEAALSVLEKLPKFKPARCNQKNVNSLKYLFVHFKVRS